jgi:NADH:ubiquinone reductase (H+-translocating)
VMTDRKRVVIVGGGFGGLALARSLAQTDVDVALVDRENHHLFQPLLYQVATAGLSPGAIAVPIRSVLSGQKNARVILDEAAEVDLERNVLVLREGRELEFDYLVAATGARTNYFGHDEWARHAHGLKSVRDAIRIRERVLVAFEEAEMETDPARRKMLLTFVVIGGGPTGVEMAGAISELGRNVLTRDYRTIAASDIRVVLVEMAPRVLAPFDPSLSEKAKLSLENLGVEVRVGEAVTDVGDARVRIGDEWVDAAIVVWASGVKPTSFVSKLGVPLDRGGRAVVGPDCSIPGRHDVFVIGDSASFVPEGEERPLPGVAPVAMQQGRYLAKVIAADLRGKPRPPFVYRDKGMMATVGRGRAVAATKRLKLSGFLAWIAWGLVHVAYLIGFHNRMMVLFEWTWSLLTAKRGARLITANIHFRDTPGRSPEVPPLVVERHGLRTRMPGERRSLRE